MSNMIIHNYANDIISQRKAAASANDPAVTSLKLNAKPYEPKGRLIDSNIIESTKYAVKKPFQEVKFFANAVRGKGDDYSIGRINDLGLKLGSLGIAAILAASAKSPFKKGMEFVGLGTWFASMALWPKMIGSAVKFTKGFDPNQKYEDSYGRVKPLLQDPQFICWELVDNETLENVADKNGIPKNIENRDEAARKKMQQIATQSNTLTMLTAGFATPIMSSLLADQIGGKIVDPAVEKFMIKKAKQSFDEPISANKDVLSEISTTLKDVDSMPHVKKKNFAAKINDMFKYTKIGGGVEKEINNVLNNDAPFTVSVTPELVHLLQEETKNNAGPKTGDLIASKADSVLDKKGFQNYLRQINRSLQFDVREQQHGKPKEMFERISVKNDDLFGKFFTDTILDGSAERMSEIYTYSNKFDVHKKRLDKYLAATLSDVDGSATANNWKNASGKFIKTMGFSNDDLNLLANEKTDHKTVNAIVEKRLNKILSSSESTSDAIKGILNFYVKSTSKDERFAQEALKYIDKIDTDTVEQVRGLNLNALADDMSLALNSDKRLISAKVLNTKTSFSRPINVLNVMTNISEALDYKDTEGADSIIRLKNSLYSPADGDEATKEVAKMVKDIMFNNEDASSFFNKFEQYNLKPKNKETFNNLLDVLFAPLNPQIRKSMPAKVADEIDANNEAMKTLFSVLDNPIKPELNTSPFDLLTKIKDGKSFEYIKNFISVNWTGNADNSIKEFWNYLKDNGNFDDFLVLLKKEGIDGADLAENSDNFVKTFKKSGKDLLWSVYGGAKGKSDMQSALKKALDNSVGGIKGVDIQDATMSAGQGFVDFVRKTAADTVSYKTWLKRAGIAASVLTGITAIGVAMMGRKNKFNTDTYKYKTEGVNNGK